MMEAEFRAVLKADAAITGLCGNRINYGVNPQGAGYPAIVLNLISDVGSYTLDGRTGVSADRIQVDCLASSYGGAMLLSDHVLTCLSGYSGGVIQGVFHEISRAGHEAAANEAVIYRRSMDFIVRF